MLEYGVCDPPSPPGLPAFSPARGVCKCKGERPHLSSRAKTSCASFVASAPSMAAMLRRDAHTHTHTHARAHELMKSTVGQAKRPHTCPLDRSITATRTVWTRARPSGVPHIRETNCARHLSHRTEITPRAQEITPRAQEITPRAQEITPRAQEITPRAQEITPYAQ
eukprot:184157-Prorocentrum_minimum.AAC.1